MSSKKSGFDAKGAVVAVIGSVLVACSWFFTHPVVRSSVGIALPIILSSWLQWFVSKRQKHEEETRQAISFLKAIKAEVSSLWDRHQKVVGGFLENLKDDQSFDGTYQLSDNYFVVYNNNSALLGFLNDALTQEIVKVYTIARSFVDSFVINNQTLRDRQNVFYRSLDGGKEGVYQKLLKGYNDSMVQHAKVLKDSHLAIKEMIPSLCKLIDAEVAGLEMELKVGFFVPWAKGVFGFFVGGLKKVWGVLRLGWLVGFLRFLAGAVMVGLARLMM